MAMRTRGSTRFAIPAMMEGDDEGSPNFQPTVGGAGSSPQLDTYGGASSDGQSSTDSSANSSPLVRGMVGGGSSASQPGTGHRLPLGMISGGVMGHDAIFVLARNTRRR